MKKHNDRDSHTLDILTREVGLLEMEDGRDYVAYRDADKQAVCMLIRRRDGHYDLIET